MKSVVNWLVGQRNWARDLVHSFTHDIEMPWILPRVAPTGKKVEVAIVAVAEFELDKIAGNASRGIRRRS